MKEYKYPSILKTLWCCLILLALFIWQMILIGPLLLLYGFTGKDYSRYWMVSWVNKLTGMKL